MTIWEVSFSVALSTAAILLGWYGREFLDERIQRRRRSRFLSKKETLRAGATEWLVDYYVNSGEGELLFSLPNGKKIPYLSRADWQLTQSPQLDLRYSIEVHECRLAIDRSIIRDRELAGQRLWDGPVFCLGGVVSRGAEISVTLRQCSYFQYATLASTLQDELVRCQAKPRRVPRLRNRSARSVVQLESGALRAQILGITTAIVLESKGEHRVLIQTRTDETGIAQGMRAVVPSFVCNSSRYDDRCLPLDRHFFLLEFLEELYNRTELETGDSYVSPDWFYTEDPAARLLPLLKDQGPATRFRTLGLGFDLHTGEFHVATCFVIRESDLSASDVQRMRFNYEISGIEEFALGSDRLDQLIVSDSLYVTSAFTLSCLSRYFEQGDLTRR